MPTPLFLLVAYSCKISQIYATFEKFTPLFKILAKFKSGIWRKLGYRKGWRKFVMGDKFTPQREKKKKKKKRLQKTRKGQP
jgi:hypothetical protein